MATLYTQRLNEHADGSLIYLCHLGISKAIEQSVCSFSARGALVSTGSCYIFRTGNTCKL